MVKPLSRLVAIKLAHTAVWFLFAVSIVLLPVAGLGHWFGWAAVLSGAVLIECAVLALNRMHCPLTDVAARYTQDRGANFDIYLPQWLAKHNKTIFGSLFVAGELVVLWQWLLSRG